ncbi:glycerate kinase [Granulicoccus phenolivorans]|uniref:glycerate kinase n=1 Tax=Granulicoccus phenolivorans TaxID=266854 RepID=UPI00040C2232|nr:glycerate kinase [Granulicoccus phenolivorans]
MRILIATDAIGPYASAEAGTAIARGWRTTAPDADLAVLPIGEAGAGLCDAYAALHGTQAELTTDETGSLIRVLPTDDGVLLSVAAANPPELDLGLPLQATSAPVGAALAEVLATRPQRVLVDLGELHCHDAGAGILGALGARSDRPLDEGAEALAGMTWLDLAPVRELVGTTELIAVVRSELAGQHLLGLRGITSLRGRAGDMDPQRMIAIDETLERFANLCAPEAALLPGAGADGAYALAALGGRICTGPQLCADAADLSRTLPLADLVVTGATGFDFGSAGGPVVRYLADRAEQATRPVIALAAQVWISAREMRQFGIESAYAMEREPDAVTDADLTEFAARVARSWRFP